MLPLEYYLQVRTFNIIIIIIIIIIISSSSSSSSSSISIIIIINCNWLSPGGSVYFTHTKL